MGWVIKFVVEEEGEILSKKIRQGGTVVDKKEGR